MLNLVVGCPLSPPRSWSKLLPHSMTLTLVASASFGSTPAAASSLQQSTQGKVAMASGSNRIALAPTHWGYSSTHGILGSFSSYPFPCSSHNGSAPFWTKKLQHLGTRLPRLPWFLWSIYIHTYILVNTVKYQYTYTKHIIYISIVWW